MQTIAVSALVVAILTGLFAVSRYAKGLKRLALITSGIFLALAVVLFAVAWIQ